MRAVIIIGLLISFIGNVYSQSTIQGRVLSTGEPVSFVNVALEGTSLGAATDDYGRFALQAIPPGEYTLVVSAIGYLPLRQTISLSKGQAMNLGDITIEENTLGLNEVVVTGTMNESYLTSSPVKVEVIPASKLQRNLAPTSLMDGLTLINGVQEVVACGVCFTNSISINGLPGPYTAVLMDGTPIYGNLASVYGLNGIPTQIIDRFEVIKGPNSTLYGSEAVAGVINIITKDPKNQPLLQADIMGTTHRESFGNLAVAPQLGKWNGFVGLNYAYLPEYEDNNGDGFGDMIQLDRWSGFTKWNMDRPNQKRFSLAAKYYYEDRRNGVEAFMTDRAYQDLRGNDSIYGESIYTNRWEAFGTYDLPGEQPISLDFSLSHHDQDSYYGADHYVADQRIYFLNSIWKPRLGVHGLVIGTTLRYQYYDDNTVATGNEDTNLPDRQFIPGIFAQDEWQASDQWTLLGGMRLDYYPSHGPIASPRLNVKYSPGTWTTLRANFGTGFRIVNLFTEDHAFITGQRSVVLEESLDPERSVNGSLNFNHVYTLGDGQGMLDIDAFYTYFYNKIIPDYDTPGEIRYGNTDGHAVTMGIGANLSHQFRIPLSVSTGINLQRVTQTERNEEGAWEQSPVEYAPQWTGVSTVNYDWKDKGLLFAYTLNLTGPMALPEVFDVGEDGELLPIARPTTSETFAFQNLQVTKTFNRAWQIYVGIQNLLNYRQQISPLTGFDDPNFAPGFSPYFDTAYAFSPIHGREFYLGVRWNLMR
ncbi:MAG TPA: TonB-dependent receptor [Cytophagales bacterium]|nr:TonB-dependent receptor [Cytophagales bacterium]HAA19835.1 TonB-dependent receptor [Cytophagales bacterium]HAP63771.1 TonB-dependent receptor [Cytophagales bacterium]